MLRDYYQILGVPRDASVEHIRHAFRMLAREFHPDVNKGYAAAAIFERLVEAYETLADPQRRAAYDAALRDEERSAPTEENRPPEPETRQRMTEAEQLDEVLAQIREAKRVTLTAFLYAMAWFIGGSLLTWGMYQNAQGGGIYVVFWGAILYGGYRALVTGWHLVRLLMIERQLLGRPWSALSKRFAWAAASLVLVGFVGYSALANSPPTPTTMGAVATSSSTPLQSFDWKPKSSPMQPSATTSRTPSFASSSRTESPTFVPTPVPTLPPTLRPTPTPSPTPYANAAHKAILDTPDLPFDAVAKYSVTKDEKTGDYGWRRTYMPISGWKYGALSIYVSIIPSGYLWTQDLSCDLTFTGEQPVASGPITAIRLATSSIACRYAFADGWRYLQYSARTATSYASVWLAASDSVDDTTELNQVITVVQKQLSRVP